MCTVESNFHLSLMIPLAAHAATLIRDVLEMDLMAYCEHLFLEIPGEHEEEPDLRAGPMQPPSIRLSCGSTVALKAPQPRQFTRQIIIRVYSI